jgi:ABC-type lipoprotein release transport system permease subunit
MRKWLLAAIVATAVIPSAALLTAARSGAAVSLERARDGIGDALVDAPGAPAGLITSPGTLAAAVAAHPSVSHATRLVSGPGLIERGRARRVVRIEGVWPRSSRLSRLDRLVVSGRVDDLATGRDEVALGEALAADLGVRPGDQISLLGLAPGPGATGFRRRTLQVVALYRSGLAGLDGAVALVGVETARGLLASGDGASGVVAWLSGSARSDAAASGLSRVVGDDRRVRLGAERDQPIVDPIAALDMAQSTMALALLAALLAAALAGPGGRRPYGETLGRIAVPAGLAILAALGAGAATASLVGGRGFAEGLIDARVDLGRLLLAAALGALGAPVLVGRVRRGATGLTAAFLILLIGLATTEPAAAAVVASGARRAASGSVRAARDLARLAGSRPLPAAVSLGAEVVPVDLVGVDPARRGALELLGRLAGGPAVALRQAGAARPRRAAASEGIEELLDRIATNGAGAAAREAPPERSREPAPPPGLVIGRGVARRLGARPGDRVTVAAAPGWLSQDEAVPPWPVTFTVAAVAELGPRSLDGRLVLADVWQVEALGGDTRGARTALASEAASRQAAAAPFEALARRSACAGALQIALAAFALGALIGGGRRRSWATLALCALAGVAAGVLMGVSEATQGLVAIGDPAWYEALPRGRASVADVLSPWPYLPALTGVVAAAAGALSAGRLGVGRERDGEADH